MIDSKVNLYIYIIYRYTFFIGYNLYLPCLNSMPLILLIAPDVLEFI